MARTLEDRIWQALKDRGTWEERQRLFYAMRRDGLRRRNKPYKGAADLHLPIADNAVDKLKPYYLNGIFGRQQLASFTALKRQLGEATAAAAECLDYKLRKESNYPLEMAHTVDGALGCGRFILKTRWDPEEERLAFEGIDPLFFICPTDGGEIDEMDWFVHVQQPTVAKYKRDKRYKQSEELIERIRGGAKQEEFTKSQEKAHREGLTWTRDEDKILLWEVYERVEQGWLVRTYSPCAPQEPVREPFILGYKWQGKPLQPFVSFRREITDKGWYAPRGVVEKVATFQSYATKLWNSKADWLDFSTKPLFTQDVNSAAGTNRENVRLAPGEVLPPGLVPASMPEPPFALDNEINNVRQLAEESAGSPDFGIQGEEARGGKQASRTATEWNYLGSFANQGIQMAGWVWALSEGEVYKRAWALLVQFGGDKMAWWRSGEEKVLPQQARHDAYLIEPDSQPDAWDKAKRFQRAAARKQMFQGNPNIDQLELDRSVIEADDPRLVKKLLIGQSVRAGEEMEDEAKEILLLERGFPCVVNPGEDHALRIKVIAGYLQLQGMRGVPVDPIARQRLQEHLATHVQFLQEQNPQAARKFMAAIGALDPGNRTDGTAVTNGTGTLGLPAGASSPGGGPSVGSGAPPLNGLPAGFPG